MARFGFIRFGCSLLTAMWSLSALAQEVADKPDLRLGDEWVFREKGVEDGKPVDRTWRRRIVEILPDDKFRVTPKYGSIEVFDRSWNYRHPERPDFWPIDFQFPLRVGASWSFASPYGASTTKAQNFDQRGHYKVVAFETVSVPAGTFKCFRIEGESHWLHGNTYSSDWHFVGRWLITNWYCPDIKYIAKSHIERHTSGTLLKATYRELDSELLVFKPGKRIASISPLDQGAAKEGAQRSLFDGRWEGEQGIWRIKGRVSSQRIEGTIQCRSKDRWSAQSPTFVGTVEEDGTVDADTAEELKGWAPREIKGKLPDLRVVGYGKLDCPNGEVALKKVE